MRPPWTFHPGLSGDGVAVGPHRVYGCRVQDKVPPGAVPDALPPEDGAWAMIGEWMVDQRTYILSMMYVN